MNWVAIFLIGILANLDNFLLGISLKEKNGIKRKFDINKIVLGTGVPLITAMMISHLLIFNFTKYQGKILGIIILLFINLFILVLVLFYRKKGFNNLNQNKSYIEYLIKIYYFKVEDFNHYDLLKLSLLINVDNAIVIFVLNLIYGESFLVFSLYLLLSLIFITLGCGLTSINYFKNY